MTKTWSVMGVFCEDVREEKSGQVTIVGILPDSIQLPPPPEAMADKAHAIVLPKLGLYIRLAVPLRGMTGPLPISLSLADGTSLPLGEIDDELIEKAIREARQSDLPLAGVVFHALLQGFQTKPGLLSAVVEHKGKKQICAILRVKPAIPT